MKDEYIIINKTAIEKRIEELEKEIIGAITNEQKMLLTHELNILKILISQSTPLIPEIEKAFEQGRLTNSVLSTDKDYVSKQDYISNLKLDI